MSNAVAIDRAKSMKRDACDAAEEILTKAKAANRSLTTAEERSFDAHMADAKDLANRIDELESGERSALAADASLRQLHGGNTYRSLSRTDIEIDEKFRQTIAQRSLAPFEITQRSDEMRSGFRPGIEGRALATTSGGGLVATSFWSQLQRHLVASSSILAAGATVIQTPTGEPLKVPKTTAFSTASLIAEGATIPTSDPTLGSAQLDAYKYGFLVQVSYELAADANFDLLGFLAEQSGLAIGNAFGAHAISGTGTGQPNGILTGATLGVTGPTGTATSLGSQTTVGQGADLLIDLQGSLAGPYARSESAAWLMRQSTLQIVKKLRDSTGRYIFSADIVPGSGSAGTILGRPVFVDEAMPAAGANAKSILYGDISKYWVRQVGAIRFERSDEFAFDRDLVTFRGLARLDGDLIDTTGAIKWFAHSAT
ncbi:phage major capsid protein [Cryobacterium sp. TMT4-31]|nr:phage major capsid protein [Cryobacterium sp. TMT4-31]